MPETVSGVFRLPFAEQIAAMRLRFGDLRATAKWNDLAGVEHDRAFMVAGAVKAELLADLAAAVDRAVSEGTTLDEFRRDFRAIVEKHGWHGWTGEGTKKGEAWRTRVIYRTNIATTYAAGRLAQLRAEGYTFWVYRHSGAEHPRLDHLSWDGLVLPSDHAFWTTHYPPNGWGCGCRVTGARSERGARRLGGDPSKPLPPGWDRIDPKTGTPPGIGKGWDHAPGDTVSDLVSALADRLPGMPHELASDVLQAWIGLRSFEQWYEQPVREWPLVMIPDRDAEAIGAKVRIAVLSAQTAMKQRRQHPELAAADYALAQAAVDEAQLRLVDRDPEIGTMSMLYVWTQGSEESGGYVIVVKATKTGYGLFVTSLRRLSRDAARRDAEISRLIAKATRLPS